MTTVSTVTVSASVSVFLPSTTPIISAIATTTATDSSTSTSMSTSTSTSTIPLVLHLVPLSRRVDYNPSYQRYQPFYQELLVILDIHRHNQDFSSNQIFRWSVYVIQAFENVNLDDPESERIMTPLIHNRVNELRQEILVNPLDESGLRDPILVRDWVWERWMWEECRQLFPMCPLDRGEMIASPPPHTFAIEMLNLVNRFIHQTQGEHEVAVAIPATHYSTYAEDDSLAAQPALPLMSASTAASYTMVPLQGQPNAAQIMQRRMIYIKMCRAAIFQRENQKLRQNLEDTVSQIHGRVEEMRVHSMQALQEAQEEARIAEERIRRTLNDVEQTHQETQAGLQRQIATQERNYREREEALLAQVNAQDQTQTQNLHLLNQQLTDAKQASKDAIAGLNRQMETLNISHTTTVTQLNQQVEQSRQQHQAAVQATQRAREETVRLGTELHTTNARLQNANQNLADAQAQNAANTAQINSLYQQLANAHQQLQNVGRGGGGGKKCVIS